MRHRTWRAIVLALALATPGAARAQDAGAADAGVARAQDAGAADAGVARAQDAGAPPPPPPEVKAEWTPHAGAQIDLGGRKRLFVGDVFTVRVTVIARAAVSVNLPTSLELGDFSVLGTEPPKVEKLDGDKVKHELRLRVAAYNVGELTLPPIPVTYVPPPEAFATAAAPGSAPAAQVVRTAPLRQRIASVLANEPDPQLKRNAPPVSILVEDRRMKIALLVVACVLAGAALGFLLYALWRRRRRRPRPAPPPRPAHEIAFEKLAAIRAAGYLDRGEFKAFYVDVSEAIREYLGNRYHFDSLELTTTEMMEELARVAVVGVGRDEIHRFLLDCDLVKFAKYVPALEEARQTLDQADHLVRATLLVPVVEPGPPADDVPPGAGAAPRPERPEEASRG